MTKLTFISKELKELLKPFKRKSKEDVLDILNVIVDHKISMLKNSSLLYYSDLGYEVYLDLMILNDLLIFTCPYKKCIYFSAGSDAATVRQLDFLHELSSELGLSVENIVFGHDYCDLNGKLKNLPNDGCAYFVKT